MNEDYRIIQMTDSETGTHLGLYLVPKSVSLQRFEDEFKYFENQDDFDEDNELGAERYIADEAFVVLN